MYHVKRQGKFFYHIFIIVFWKLYRQWWPCIDYANTNMYKKKDKKAAWEGPGRPSTHSLEQLCSSMSTWDTVTLEVWSNGPFHLHSTDVSAHPLNYKWIHERWGFYSTSLGLPAWVYTNYKHRLFCELLDAIKTENYLCITAILYACCNIRFKISFFPNSL